MGALLKVVAEKAQAKIGTLLSKKVGASAGGVALIASGQAEAGWAAIVYAAIQGIVDVAKYYIDKKYAE